MEKTFVPKFDPDKPSDKPKEPVAFVPLEPPKPTDSLKKARIYYEVQRILKEYGQESSIPVDYEYWDLVKQYKRVS